MGRSLRVAAWVVVLATAVIGVVLASRFGIDPTLVESPLIGTQIPDVELSMLGSGEPFSLDEVSGEVLVINFWASWCLACREEHPALLATAAAYRDRGVRFVGISFSDEDKNAIAYLNELGWGEDTLFVTDPKGRAAIEFGVFGVPETFFIAPDGTIVGKVSGATNALLLATTIDAILAGERPGEKTVGETFTPPGG